MDDLRSKEGRSPDQRSLEGLGPDLLTIEQLASEAGVPVRTARLYRQLGAIRPVRVGRRALYRREDALRLRAIRMADSTLPERACAQVFVYRLGDEQRASEVVASYLVDGSVVMVLRDSTVVIHRPVSG